MTKNVIKWYRKVKLWQFVAYVLTPFAVLGEGAILTLNLPWWLHIVVVVAIMQGGSLYTFAEWTGDEADFASFSLGVTNGELYVTAAELIKLN